MAQLLDKPTEQNFIQRGVSWTDFKAIQSGFANSPGIRLFYYQGELEILSTSPMHEVVKGNLGFLVERYMLDGGIEYIATGSCTQENAEERVSVQADESYCLGQMKSIPDLSIEVVITSGGTDKLKRYAALGVSEVWFWEDNQISVYCLDENIYHQVDRSYFFPELNLELLGRCVAIASRSEAAKCFRQRQ